MERVGDIMARYGQAEADELAAIKRYIDERYHATARVAYSGDVIVITVQSAALANTLRLHLPRLREACHIEKRLILRIG